MFYSNLGYQQHVNISMKRVGPSWSLQLIDIYEVITTVLY